jgi:hypothetical protein
MSLHAKIARLKGELKKRDLRSNTEALTARHRAALDTERARNVILSTRIKALINIVGVWNG